MAPAFGCILPLRRKTHGSHGWRRVMSSQPAHRTMIIVCGASLAFGIARCWHAAFVALTLACAVLASPVVRADDAAEARDRGRAAIDAFVDNFRRTGDTASKLAELNAAAPALMAAANSWDDALRFYALLDRADVWMTMGFCDATRPTENCLQQVDRALRDYAHAREVATRLGWAGLVSQIDGFIGRAQLQAQNVRSILALNKVVGQLANQFKPKTARNVSVSETFVTVNPEGATALRPVLEKLKLMEARAGGYSDVSAARSRFLDGLQHQMEGRFDPALASYRSALELFESDRGKLQDDADRGGYFANKLTFYYRPIEVLLEKRNYAEAFDLFERSKARAMADL